ncbi:hypothetical protein [Globicatella sanguinis]|uniref:hypothetical protein n=1 Tax=Globicatella sanguinis TaxID=13076 RepID=UPI00082609A5|nr:hypothetical protein [Globicatella sanguinis]
MKDIRWLFILVLTVLLGFSIYRDDETWISILIVLVMIVAWYFNDIKEVTMSADKISIKKKEERLDELTNEAENLIKYINDSIDPIIQYNLAQLRTDGTFDEIVGLPFVINFLVSAKNMAINMKQDKKYDMQLMNLKNTVVHNFHIGAGRISKKYNDEIQNNNKSRDLLNRQYSESYDNLKPFDDEYLRLKNIDPEN